MTIHERATQIWPVLACSAHNRQVITYNILWLKQGCPQVEEFRSAAEQHAADEQLPLPELDTVTSVVA